MHIDQPAAQVLVVDDDQEICEVVRLALEDAGYESLQTRDGQTALDMLRSSPSPLVVLLDQLMPGMNGTEVLRIIQADPALATRHAYILMTASSSAPFSAISQLTNLSVTVLRKPFELDVLFDLVEQASARLHAPG